MNKFLKFFLQIQNQQIGHIRSVQYGKIGKNQKKSVKLKIFFSISTLSKLKLILNHAVISLHIIEKKILLTIMGVEVILIKN